METQPERYQISLPYVSLFFSYFEKRHSYRGQLCSFGLYQTHFSSPSFASEFTVTLHYYLSEFRTLPSSTSLWLKKIKAVRQAPVSQ